MVLEPSPVIPAKCAIEPLSILGKDLSTPQKTATEKIVEAK